jgi:dienelactone hydrolase
MRFVPARVGTVAVFAMLAVQGPVARAQTDRLHQPSWAVDPPVSRSADARQFAEWRKQIKQALFIPDPLPPIAALSYGSFSPVAGVVAERVTYATTYGMRVPAIVYRPAKASGRLPGMVVVNGHGGDKTSWYAYYTGILYARAGAVVVTYDPVGEDERNSGRKSDARAHDTFVPGAQMPERMGGQMIGDVMQAVGYLAQRKDVDGRRIAVLGFSMGSFHAAIAGALDPRIHALVLSGGGNLDGAGGYWESSPKVMCQAGPYKALSFLGDRGAVLYALNQNRGATLVMNGTVDPLILSKNTLEPFFEDLRNRAAAISGTREGLFETFWIPGAGHRPNFVTRPGALWLESQLHFPNWTEASIRAMGEVHMSEWATQGGAPAGGPLANEVAEGGVRALDAGVPIVPREELQAVPSTEWEQHKGDFVWESWVERARAVALRSGADSGGAEQPVSAR